MYSVSATQGELYYMRLLLLNVRGAQSFDHVKNCERAFIRNLQRSRHCTAFCFADDSEWENCLEEAQSFQMPRQLRQLFAYICVFCEPKFPNVLWENYKNHHIEDFLHQNLDEEAAINIALRDIQDVLMLHGKKCARF